MKFLRVLTLAIAALAFTMAGCTNAAHNADVAQDNTRPSAESAPDYGLTMSGEVTEVDDDSLVIETTTGAETVQILDTTRMAVEPRVGDRVSVDFQRSSADAMIATEVRVTDNMGR